MSKEMSKQELLELVESMKLENEKLKSRRGAGRKEQVLEVLKKAEADCSISYIAEELAVERKNISSIINGIKKMDSYKKDFVLFSFNFEGEKLYRYVGNDDSNWSVLKDLC